MQNVWYAALEESNTWDGELRRVTVLFKAFITARL